MKTYLKVTVNSEGATPTQIRDRLMNMGFKTTQGHYDFVYEWPESASLDDILWFADRVHAALKGMQVLFELETT